MHPIAVIIEILVADHIVGDVAGRSGALVLPLSIIRPGFKCRARGQALDLRMQRVEPAEYAHFAFAHAVERAGARHFGLTAAHLHHCAIVVGIRFEVVLAGMQDADGRIRCFDAELFALGKPPHAHCRRALGQAHLHHVVIELDEAEAGATVEMHRRRTDLKLSSRIRPDPQPVFAGDGAIQNGFDPLFAARGREGHFAVDQAEPGDAARGIAVFRIDRQRISPEHSAEEREQKLRERCGGSHEHGLD